MIEVTHITESEAAPATAELDTLYEYGPIDPAGLARALRNPDFVLLVAHRHGLGAGYLHGTILDKVDGTRMLLVYDLSVIAAHRRSGVGTALMAEARRIAAAGGVSETWLVTDPSDRTATAFYESLGGTKFAACGFEWDGT